MWTAQRSRWTSGEQEVLEIGEIHDFTHTSLSEEEADAFGLGIFASEEDTQPGDANDRSQPNQADLTQQTPSIENQQDTQSPGVNAGLATSRDSEASDIEIAEEGNGLETSAHQTVMASTSASGGGLLGKLIQEARETGTANTSVAKQRTKKTAADHTSEPSDSADESLASYEPVNAAATAQMPMLFAFRSINPLYGLFLAEHMHKASYEERLQLLEAVLDMPRSVSGMVRVPFPDQMPPGPLATEFLDGQLIARGLATADDLQGSRDEETGRRIPPLVLGDKMRMLFRSEFPGVDDVFSNSVWCVGDLLKYGGNFDRYVRSRELTKQEGIIFRHCLRMILLCGEFSQIEPPMIDPAEWRNDLAELAFILTEACRAVDPDSTDEVIEALQNQVVNTDQL